MHPGAASRLLGREAECSRIAGLLADARRRHSGALVLTGEAGAGKTALCDWAAAQAGGMRVVSVRGIESELDLPFAGLSELSVELGQPAPGRRPPPLDRFAAGAAVLELLG